MSGGQPQGARQLATSGLFDDVVTGDVIGAAAARATVLAEKGAPYPRARDGELDAAEVQSTVAAQRAKLTARQKLQPAYGALLAALAASTLPFDAGLQKERDLFLALVPTTAAQAQRYQFKVEREATKLPPAFQVPAREVRSIAVIGAGTMGSGIAISALDVGLAVLLLEQDGAALERGRQRIADHYRERVAAGKLGRRRVVQRGTPSGQP